MTDPASQGSIGAAATAAQAKDEEIVPFGNIKSNSIQYSFATSPVAGKRPRRPRRSSTSVNAALPDSLRWLVNGTALISCLCFSGIIYGWAPLKMMLLRENQFAELCSIPSETDAMTTTTTTPCAAQLAAYNALFTTAQFVLSFASLPVGILLDRVSNKVWYFGLTATLEISGLVLLGWADSATNNHYTLAVILLALGGCLTMLGAFPATFLLPHHQAGLLAAISCLFDASSVLFTMFDHLNIMAATPFSRRNLCLTWASVAGLVYAVLLFGWWQLEKQNWTQAVMMIAQQEEQKIQNQYQDNQQTAYDSMQHGDNGISKETSPRCSTQVVDRHTARIRRLGLHQWSAARQLMSLEFALVVIFASVQMTRCNFYIETVNEMLQWTAGDLNGHMARIFAWVLPAGIVFVPLVERSVQRLGVLGTLHVTNTLGLIFGSLVLTPWGSLQVLNFAVFTGFRAFLYATLNTFIAFSFGVNTMGRMVGSTFTTAAVVTLLQYPAANVAEKYDQDFTRINIIFLAAGLIPALLTTGYDVLVLRPKGKQEDQLERDNDKFLMPAASIDDERSRLLSNKQQQHRASEKETI